MKGFEPLWTASKTVILTNWMTSQSNALKTTCRFKAWQLTGPVVTDYRKELALFHNHSFQKPDEKEPV